MEHLNSDIDALSGTTTHAELVAATQKVLRTMAYYISQSEAAVLEYREGWHDDYTNALYSDAGRSRGDGQPASAARAASGSMRPPSAAAAAAPRTERKTGGKGRRGGARGARGSTPSTRDEVEAMIEASRAEAQARIEAAHRGAVSRTAAARPRQADVPDSLRAIMDGTHPSFKEDDGF